jgi:two-component system sensor histidine kinase AlgZ
MLGRVSSRRGAALYLLAWLLLALVLAGLVVASTGAAWADAVWLAIPVMMVYAFATGFSAYYLCRAYPLAQKNPLAIAAVFGVTAVFAGALLTALAVGWNATTHGVELSAPAQALMFGLGVILYGLSAVAHYLAIELERARLAERRELESQLMAQEAQLRMLRTQIDPHFLFNSLNSISALTSLDPAAARQMTLQLADFFRHSLSLEPQRKVTLDAETALLRDFLAIEQVRFGARLRVEHDIADQARACLLPPMLLQPLVENALKHGIGNLTDGGTLRIAAVRAASILHVRIENDVDDDQSAPRAGGIGLANVRQRLAAEYGHRASLHCARSERRFIAQLALPAETAPS